MIYRIAESLDWLDATPHGHFASADLAAERFIHLLEWHQILRTANKYYRGKAALMLLEIDEALLDEPVVREDVTGSGAFFPHSYAPIPLLAIVRQFSFRADADGEYSLPDGLAH